MDSLKSQAGLDDTLAALADPVRRQVVELLRVRPRRAGDLSRVLGVSASVASKHLRVLKASGLVDPALDEGDGRGRVYALRPERLNTLSAWVEEMQTHWNDQMSALKSHVESGNDAP